MSQLDLVADRQADWSATANRLKTTLDRTRWVILALSVGGALAAAVASQMQINEKIPLLSNPRTWVAIAGAASLAAATFFTARLLGANAIAAWARARAVAEALKREG